MRVPGDNGGGKSDRGHFYTYNHDIDHPYFARRPGFVRGNVKYQGLVGTLGDEGKTRLTWLVNMDPGGMVPSAFVNGLLVGLMATPFLIVKQTEEYLGVRKGGDVADSLAESSSTQEDNEGKGNEASLDSKRESAAELKLKAELAEMKAEMARKDESLQKKEEEHRVVLAEKEEEHRVVLAEKVEEHQVVLAEKEEEHRVVLAGKDKELKAKEAEIQEHRVVLEGKDEELKTKEAEIQELRRRLPRSSVDSDE